MPNYTYTDNIPFSTDNPSNDQPLMQTNTNSIDSIIGEDHFSFNNNNGGLHQKTRLVNIVGMGPPSGIAAGMGTLYTKTVATTASTNESTLFYVPDGTINQYQITRTIAPDGATFGTNNAYGSPVVGITQVGGWTFLPGGMLLQYGNLSGFTSGDQTVQFPVTFSTAVYGVFTMPVGSTINSYAPVNVISTSQFTMHSTSISMTKGVNWMAIGV